MNAQNKRTEQELIGLLVITEDGRIKNLKTGTIYKEYHRGIMKYHCFRANGKDWCKHRVVWTLTHGPIPEGYVVDHIDGDVSNNHIDNLRLATQRQNMCNRAVNQAKASGLPKGITKRPNGSYRACLRYAGKSYTKESKSLEVVSQWLSEKREGLHGEFAKD